jgi:hypothetical protein
MAHCNYGHEPGYTEPISPAGVEEGKTIEILYPTFGRSSMEFQAIVFTLIFVSSRGRLSSASS